MGRGAFLACGVACSVFVYGSGAGAETLPTCRVRAVKSGATEDAPKAAFAQVQGWVDARQRGVRLVQTIDEADVLLELREYRPTTMPDGTPAEEWLFVARRLSESNAHRATYRFGYVTCLDRRTKAHVAQALPTVLTDVCFGYLPKVASGQE
jgi:hypothetical protein